LIKQKLYEDSANKLGYPVSLETSEGDLDLSELGVTKGSLANIFINNVGDPVKDSQSFQMEVKSFEREVILMFGNYFKITDVCGYVTSGGTEANQAGIWWAKRRLALSDSKLRSLVDESIKSLESQLHPINTLSSSKKIALQRQLLKEYKVREDLSFPGLFYTKDHTHYSIKKIADINHLRVIEIDSSDSGKMDLNDFEVKVKEFIESYPHAQIIVNANIGTTITGAFDDIPGIKKILMQNIPDRHAIHIDGALTGMVLPLLKLFGERADYLNSIGGDSIAVSGHKFLGLPQPCGVILTTLPKLHAAFSQTSHHIEYVGNIHDITVAGSRSGFNVLMLHKALTHLELNTSSNKLQIQLNNSLSQAINLQHQLEIFYPKHQVQLPNHFHVLFPKPSEAIAKKYQLMQNGKNAVACILNNVSTKLIKSFIIDLKDEIENSIEDNHYATSKYKS